MGNSFGDGDPMLNVGSSCWIWWRGQLQPQNIPTPTDIINFRHSTSYNMHSLLLVFSNLWRIPACDSKYLKCLRATRSIWSIAEHVQKAQQQMQYIFECVGSVWMIFLISCNLPCKSENHEQTTCLTHQPSPAISRELPHKSHKLIIPQNTRTTTLTN